jgi:ribosomal protein S12 methylthiotransferase accessory factor
VWVPAFAAYLHYPAARAETFYAVTTNGLAAGTSAEDAASRAALELLERDSFALTWLSMSPPRPLAVRGSLEGTAAECLRQLERYAGAIEFYLLDSEVPISVVACLSSGDGKRWPGAAVGLGASLSPTVAVRKALLEQAQVGLSLRRSIRAGRVEVPASREEVHSTVDHMAYYVPAERAEALDFWRETARQPVELGSLPERRTSSLSDLKALLKRSALGLAIVDVTARDVADSPFRVARALGAGVQQIAFGFREQLLGNSGLKAMTAERPNPHPHPLG